MASPTVPASIQRTFRSGRGVAHSHSSQSDSAVLPPSPQQQHDSQHNGLKPSTNASAAQRNVFEASTADGESRPQSKTEGWKTGHGSEQATDDQNRLKVSEASDQIPSSSVRPKAQHNDQNHPRSNMVEQRSDYRDNRE